MDVETFLAQNQAFTIEEARNALEIEKGCSTLDNLLEFTEFAFFVRYR